MMKMALGAMLMTMAGCANVPPPEGEEVPAHGGSERECDASKAQFLVGKERSKKLGAEAMRLTGAGALRWIGPDTMVTMDYREDRLNLHLDARNRVTRVACG